MSWWSYRRYRLWVINTDREALLYKWDNWSLLMPSVNKLLKLTRETAFIRTFQAFEFQNKWLGFGRMIWNEGNNEKWATKYRTAEHESKLQFHGTEIWAPDWNQFYERGVPPDIYIKLYNNPKSLILKEGIVIAIPRRLALQQKEIIEAELFRLTDLIPNATLTMTTRCWYPWLRFVNNIEDMNPQELEKIVKKEK
jgi:hypothetical protein